MDNGQNKDAVAEEARARLVEMGPITTKKMFGGIGIFLDGVMFAKVSGDGTLWFRVDDSNRAEYEQLGGEQFGNADKKGAPYHRVPDEVAADDDRFLAWARTAHSVAVANKKPKKRR